MCDFNRCWSHCTLQTSQIHTISLSLSLSLSLFLTHTIRPYNRLKSLWQKSCFVRTLFLWFFFFWKFSYKKEHKVTPFSTRQVAFPKVTSFVHKTGLFSKRDLMECSLWSKRDLLRSLFQKRPNEVWVSIQKETFCGLLSKRNLLKCRFLFKKRPLSVFSPKETWWIVGLYSKRDLFWSPFKICFPKETASGLLPTATWQCQSIESAIHTETHVCSRALYRQ